MFPVGVTPFDEQGLIDEDSLARSLKFYIEAGASGIAHVLGGSEFSTPDISQKLPNMLHRELLDVLRKSMELCIPQEASKIAFIK